MAMNRVQFQRGMSWRDVQSRYGNEAACEAELTQMRWPQGFVCPRCGGGAASTFRYRGKPLWQCRGCRLQTSLVAGTMFAHSHLPLTVWFQAIWLLTQSKNNVAALELSRLLGVCYASAWRLKHKLMEAMQAAESTRQLGGLVQIDDAYLGGERNGGKAGRGSENKQAFLIALETTEDNHPIHAVLTPLASFSKTALAAWGERHLAPDAEVFTDGLAAFNALRDAGHPHTVLVADSRRGACNQTRSRWVNTVLGNVKRSLDGTYHAIRFTKYAHRYLAEAAWRFNRRFNLAAILRHAVHMLIHAKHWTEKALRAIPSCLADGSR